MNEQEERSNVIAFPMKTGSRNIELEGDGAEVWETTAINPMRGEAWVKAAIAGHPDESYTESLWTTFPTLKTSSIRLAEMISPLWPRQDGGTVLAMAIREATRRSQEAICSGQDFAGRVVGVYLYGLLTAVEEVAKLDVIGVDQENRNHAWEHFIEPLPLWAKQNKIRVLLPCVAHPRQPLVLGGMRVKLLGRIASATDVGYYQKHASMG